MAEQVPAPRKKRFGLLRWGLVGLCLLLVLLGAVVGYATWSGIPRPVLSRVAQQLEHLGFQVELGRVRLRGPMLVAENIRLASRQGTSQPSVRADSARLELDTRALRHGRVRLRRIALDGASLRWTRFGPGSHDAELATNVTLEISSPEDGRQLLRANGALGNLRVQATGTITNASGFREWLFVKRPQAAPSNWAQGVDAWLAQIESAQFAPGSTLVIEGHGDGNASVEFTAALETGSLRAEHLETRRATLHATGFLARATAASSRVEVSLDTEELDAFGTAAVNLRWDGQIQLDLARRAVPRATSHVRVQTLKAKPGAAHSLEVTLLLVADGAEEGRFHTTANAEVGELRGSWGNATGTRLRASLSHGHDFGQGWEADWQLRSGPVRTRWGEAARLGLAGEARPSSPFAQWRPSDSSWGQWSRIESLELNWSCDVGQIHSPKLDLERVQSSGRWQSPVLSVDDLDVELYGGGIQGAAALDVPSREVSAAARLAFDVHKVAPLLTANSRRWLNQFGWEVPPRVSGAGRAILPAWTEAAPRWREEVMPSIRLTGEFSGSEGTFRGVSVAYARSHFALTNATWYLPDLQVERPDGHVLLGYEGDMQTHEYHWKVDGRVNPEAAQPLLEQEQARRILGEFAFAEPVRIRGDVWGRWREPETVVFNGSVVATNFSFRGEHCTELSGLLRLTNATLFAEDLRVRRDRQEIQVPLAAFDLVERTIFVTNAVSTMDPDLVTRVIGPKVRAALRPYRFDVPPRVVVNGRLPTVNTEDADVHFALEGESFNYWKLHVPKVRGDVYWRGDALSITNVHGQCYGGELEWQGEFNFAVPVGAELSFQGHLVDADLHALTRDLGFRTNNVQGILDAHVKITDANSDDWRSWDGFGEVRLRDGFLWDIPIFGFFSPVLNSIVPGVGNSRISAGNASFRLDQSVLETRDLELKSPALRLRYNGTIDLKGEVDARVRAEILRDAWGVGRLVSAMLWPISKAFEYRISGSALHPKTDPVYIPKALMWPLHPFKTLKRFFTGGDRQQPPAESGDSSPWPP